MQTFRPFALAFFLAAAGCTVRADTTSCVTSVNTLPTITSTITGSTRTWSGDTPGLDRQTSIVYTTQYPEFCPTGLRMRTYAITAYCSKAECSPHTGAPPGFTSTVAVCSSCGHEPITATLTVPIAEAAPTGEVAHGGFAGSQKNIPIPSGPDACTTCGAQEDTSHGSSPKTMPMPSNQSIKHPNPGAGGSEIITGNEGEVAAPPGANGGAQGNRPEEPSFVMGSGSSQPSVKHPAAVTGGPGAAPGSQTDMPLPSEPSPCSACGAANNLPDEPPSGFSQPFPKQPAPTAGSSRTAPKSEVHDSIVSGSSSCKTCQGSGDIPSHPSSWTVSVSSHPSADHPTSPAVGPETTGPAVVTGTATNYVNSRFGFGVIFGLALVMLGVVV
ncbi:hypothetical protein NCS57_00801000 [Fusarium keratoplasticum]|uniref:Uncharacterized protein n=1 Tax=Fusarium keratoplasticum TaxID=1328300 RepID=A0ACC0QSJ8_9HYPO|nr:hypothetical protein NCS57_00801000 [Fusarium keratoplasticum]KAI8665784.1 hypothetical protein NCS57_00801000 [Fusarium keratoplasticum]